MHQLRVSEGKAQLQARRPARAPGLELARLLTDSALPAATAQGREVYVREYGGSERACVWGGGTLALSSRAS